MSPIHRDFLAPPPPRDLGNKPLNNNQQKRNAYLRAHPKDIGAPTEAEHAHVKHMAESVMCKDVPFPILREHNWRNDLANRLVETAGIPVLRIWCVYRCKATSGQSSSVPCLERPPGETQAHVGPKAKRRALPPARLRSCSGVLGDVSKPRRWLCWRSLPTSPTHWVAHITRTLCTLDSAPLISEWGG